MSYLNSIQCIIELLEIKLNYELCLKNVSNTVKNRYKGNLTMKIDHFYWWSAFEIMPESKIQNQIKNLARTLVHFLRRKNYHHTATVVIIFM
jgi:hypothetical protein